MARLLFPAGKVISIPRGVIKTLGRADVARYSEAVTVSRVQCTVENLNGDDGHPTLRLTSKGSQNPTLLIRPGAETCDLQQGQSALLQTGDAFSLISTRPDLAIRVELDSQDSRAQCTAAAGQAAAGEAAGFTRVTAATTTVNAGTSSMELPDGTHTAALRGSDGAQASPEPGSSPSEAYTSDDGGRGAAGVQSDGGDGEHAASGAGASPGGGKAGEKKLSRGTQARGVSNGKPPARSAPAVLLLLAGLPGSGKSTFSRELLKASPVAWVHVNQDAIRGGKPGTREQCIAAARAALEEGACCVIDRCHADAAQRAVIRAVAVERGLAAHCVALQTSPELCAKRVAGRTDHPGGVQGDSSKRVVFMMSGQMTKGGSWPPAASEGFASVMDCHNDADAGAAVRAWAVYGRDDSGDGTVEGSPGNGSAMAAEAEARGVGSGSETAAGATHGSAQGRQRADGAVATLAIWNAHVAKRKPPHAGITAFFKPATTAAKGAAAAGEGPLPLLAAKALAPRSSGVQAGQTASASGSSRGKQGAGQAGKAGAAAAVKGSASSPGGARRPMDEPPTDERGAKRQAIGAPKVSSGNAIGSSLGVEVGSGARTPVADKASTRSAQRDLKGEGGSQSSQRIESDGQPCSGQTERNAFSVLMASKSRHAADGRSGTSSGGGKSAGEDVDPRFKLTSPWAQALRNTALHPEKAQQQILYKDDQVVMIQDAFPKAKHHALVIARDPTLRSIADLRKEHLPLLAHMEEVADKWVQEEHSKDPGQAKFKIGFHAVPSMCQVHMHVVSQDFDSPALKNKKHWNSFTTQFFLTLNAVKSELEANGRLTLIDQTTETQLEGKELRCHGCDKPVKSMPELKKHIVVCDAVKLLPGL